MLLSVNIISNIHNGSGLQRDYEILARELTTLGHKVEGVDYLKPYGIKNADLNIWLEVGGPDLFKYASKNWLIPNPEWWRPHWDPSRFDQVLCKTKDAFRIFSHLNSKCRYIGFMSNDCRVPSISKTPSFIHVGGKSPFKNTEAIVDAWLEYKLPYRLILISSVIKSVPETITLYGRISESMLHAAYSSCSFHLCPSQYEGWGHMIHEGLSAGGIILYTDSPVMRDFNFPGELRVAASPSRKHFLADMHKVSAKSVANTVDQVSHMDFARVEFLSSKSRVKYEQECSDFRSNLKSVMEEIS